VEENNQIVKEEIIEGELARKCVVKHMRECKQFF
jgi:hypothetical protein